MKINEIIVERKKNLGNFESLTIKVSVSPEQSEQDFGNGWESLVKESVAKLDERIVEAIKERERK